MEEGKKYLLIIEDEAILADIIRKKLVQVGYEVDLARDGLEGLDKINARKPDLILLDVRLPKRNGYQVLEQLRAREDTKQIPVLVISNSGQPVEIERMLEMGICDYIIKAEFTPQEVLSKVASCLGGSFGASHSANFYGRQPAESLESFASVHETPTEASSAGEKKKVLLVEDEKMLSDLAFMQLSRDGYEVEMVIDGESVMPKLVSWIPDLILLDIRLPDMDGFQVLQQLKMNQKYQHIPVIIISNFDLEEYRNHAKELGAVDYLVKANLDTRSISEKVGAVLKPAS